MGIFLFVYVLLCAAAAVTEELCGDQLHIGILVHEFLFVKSRNGE